MKQTLRAALLLAALSCAWLPAQAQTWPTRPIRVVVTCPAACLPDVVARDADVKVQVLLIQGALQWPRR
jgi:tripartite-type tricarboxylate transporter receptor subunit TctC